MSTSLISPDWHFAVWASLLAVASFGLWAETNRLGRTLSGGVIAMGGAMILSNIGIMPKAAPAYDCHSTGRQQRLAVTGDTRNYVRGVWLCYCKLRRCVPGWLVSLITT